MNKLDQLCTTLNEITNLYEDFAKRNNISYTRLAIIYTVLDNEFVIQKDICQTWCLPKQTVNNEILILIKNDYIILKENNIDKRSKYLLPTDKLINEYKDIYLKLNNLENKLINKVGKNMIDKVLNSLNIMKKEMEELMYE